MFPEDQSFGKTSLLVWVIVGVLLLSGAVAWVSNINGVVPSPHEAPRPDRP